MKTEFGEKQHIEKNGKIKTILCTKSVALVLLSVFFACSFVAYYKLYSSLKYAAYISETKMPTHEECIIVEDQQYYLIVEYIYNMLDPYYELNWENNTSDNVYFEWYDYGYTYDYSGPLSIDRMVISPGEKFFYRNMESNNNYVLKIYAEKDTPEELFQIPARNTRMMNNYKVAAVIIAVSIMVWGILLCLISWKYGDLLCKRTTGIAAIITFLIGMIFFVFEKEYYYIDGFALLSSFCATCGIVFAERKTVNQREDYKNNEIALSIIISTIIACTIFALMCNAKEGTWLWQFSPKIGANIKDYIIVMFVYVLSFFFLSLLFLKLKIGRKIEFYFANRETYFAILFTMLNMIRFHMGVELRIDRRILFPIFVLIFIVCYFFLKNERIPRWLIVGVYSICCILTALKSVAINFYQTAASVHHVGTYYDSIYYLVNDMPFQGGGIDIYGHYSLIYAFILKIFDENLLVIGIINFLLCALIYWLAIGCIDKIVKCDALKILAAISLLSMSGSVYLQIMPCRLLFPFGILYYILYSCDRGLTLKKQIIGYLICIFAVFWNTESGVVCAITFSIFCSFMKIRGRDRSLGRFLSSVGIQLIVVVLEIFLAFSFVRIYNSYIVDDRQEEYIETEQEEYVETVEAENTDTVLGLLTNEDYMSNVTVPIEWGNLLWVYGMIVYFCLFAIYISRTGIFGQSEEKSRDIFKICIAVMCLGIYTYYIFRCEDFMIVAMLSVLVLTLILDLGMTNLTKGSYTVKNIILKLISFGALFGLVATVMVLPSTLKETYNVIVEGENCNWTMLQKEMETFVSEIPEDTIVNGNGISMIYMSLGLPLPNSDHPKYLLSNFDFSNDLEVYKKVSIFDFEYILYCYE